MVCKYLVVVNVRNVGTQNEQKQLTVLNFSGGSQIVEKAENVQEGKHKKRKEKKRKQKKTNEGEERKTENNYDDNGRERGVCGELLCLPNCYFLLHLPTCRAFFSSSSFPVFLRDNPFHTSIYNIDKSVLVENRPLVKLIRNYIRDLSGVFSISSLVRISMTSFPVFTLFFVQKLSCLYNKKKITRWLEDMNFIFSW